MYRQAPMQKQHAFWVSAGMVVALAWAAVPA
jgi:hypothetical protein